MEAINEAFEVEVMSQGAKITVVECGLKLAAGVKAAALFLPKYIEHFFNKCEGVFEPRRHYKFKLM